MKAVAFGLLLVVAALWTRIAPADYQAGLDAYGAGDYDRAFSEWMKVADSPEGDVHPELLAETYYALGMLFWVGQGVQQDTSESALWLRQAAELNHAGAQVKLGYLYSSGEGVPQSDFEAMKWLMMAARQGDADAQYNLAVIYRDGLGVDADVAKSLQWFREAAANGDAVSAAIVKEMESASGDSVASRHAPSESGVPVSRQSSEDPLETRSPQTPVNPQSPWWVDVHGTPIEVQEAPPPAMADAQSTADVESPPPTAGPEQPAESILAAESEPETVSPAAIPPPGNSVEQTTKEDEDWLRQREPERYTIQVIALLDLQKLHTLIRRHPDWAPFALYVQQWKGQPLWVLVQGDYPDVIQARQAARKFPTDIQSRDKLWIRKFGMIQGLLK